MGIVAERIKQALEMRGMRPIRLAEEIGVDRSTISKYLASAYEPKYPTIVAMSRALGVSPEWLGGQDVPPTIDDDEFADLYSQLSFNKKAMIMDLMRSLLSE